MITKLKYFFASLTLLPAASLAASPSTIIKQKACDAAKTAGSTPIGCDGRALLGANSIFVDIITTVLFVVGAVSVLMIVIGGFRYVVSLGDSSGIKSAKDTILYAVIGLIISMMAFGIVQFVITRVN